MTNGASSAQKRGHWLGVLAAVLMAAASMPGVVLANDSDAPRRAARTRGSAQNAPHPITVAVGATSGEGSSRALLASALQDAIAQNPALQLEIAGTHGASLVLSAHVRSLTVQRDAAGVLARCDVGVVVADGGGAVRAMLDARRMVRGDPSAPDEALARSVLRGAVDGAVRNLVTRLTP